MINILQQMGIWARKTANNRNAGARKEDLVSLSARSGSNIRTEEWRITTRLSKRPRREVSLSEWLSFTERLQLVHEDILPRACSTFES